MGVQELSVETTGPTSCRAFVGSRRLLVLFVTVGLATAAGVAPAFGDTVTATIPVGAGPYAVAVDPSTDTIYVANPDGNSVSVIDGATNAVTRTVPVGAFPTSVAVDPSTDTVYAANADNNTVSVINGATNAVTTIVGVGNDPNGIAADPATDTIYATNVGDNSVSVIDGATNAVTATITVGNVPVGVAADPATDTIYVANSEDNSVSVISAKAPTTLVAAPAKIGLLSITFSATLTSAGTPVVGQTIVFSVQGHAVCHGTTNSSGGASCTVLGLALGSGSYTASYAGTTNYQASSATAKL